MFPDISIKHDMDRLVGWASGLAREQVPFAAALALTKTGQDVKQRLERDMAASFDRPTPYTLRALRLYPATKTKLQATVLWREDARNWLAPNVAGGDRRAKALEKALQAAGHLPRGWVVVPGQGARVDAFGNMDRGQVVQVLSQLRITMTAGYSRNMGWGDRRSINAQRKAGGRFFVVPTTSTSMQPGVYQRELVGGNITPVVIFVSRARYRVRLPMHDIAQAVVRDRFADNFRVAMARAKATAR